MKTGECCTACPQDVRFSPAQNVDAKRSRRDDSYNLFILQMRPARGETSCCGRAKLRVEVPAVGPAPSLGSRCSLRSGSALGTTENSVVMVCRPSTGTSETSTSGHCALSRRREILEPEVNRVPTPPPKHPPTTGRSPGEKADLHFAARPLLQTPEVARVHQRPGNPSPSVAGLGTIGTLP